MDYAKQYQEYLVRVNAALETACNTYLPEESDVCRAARYSLLGGGKRIRAVLVLAVCDMLNGDAAAADQFAAAVEMLHCYSLIHDDLPCMDDDDLRRGKPTLHREYDEATAVLAGDALQAKFNSRLPFGMQALQEFQPVGECFHRRFTKKESAIVTRFLLKSASAV